LDCLLTHIFLAACVELSDDLVNEAFVLIVGNVVDFEGGRSVSGRRRAGLYGTEEAVDFVVLVDDKRGVFASRDEDVFDFPVTAVAVIGPPVVGLAEGPESGRDEEPDVRRVGELAFGEGEGNSDVEEGIVLRGAIAVLHEGKEVADVFESVGSDDAVEIVVCERDSSGFEIVLDELRSWQHFTRTCEVKVDDEGCFVTGDRGLATAKMEGCFHSSTRSEILPTAKE